MLKQNSGRVETWIGRVNSTHLFLWGLTPVFISEREAEKDLCGTGKYQVSKLPNWFKSTQKYCSKRCNKQRQRYETATKDEQLLCRMLHRNMSGWLFCHLYLHLASLAASKCQPVFLLPAWPAYMPVHLLFSQRVCLWLRQPLWRCLWISNRVWAHPVVCGKLSTAWLTGGMTTSLGSWSLRS